MGRADRPTPEARVFAKVTEGENGCWEWRGRGANTYGTAFQDGGKAWLPHRWSYTYLRADIPEGLELDHLCRNRVCVNPWHLEPVTRSENAKRTFQAAEHHASLIGV